MTEVGNKGTVNALWHSDVGLESSLFMSRDSKVHAN